MAAATEEEKTNVVARNAADLQRMRLEKLMSKPEKPVYIPERPNERKMKEPPEFVRNVWGSSAGAGSGEFHVYRGIRRREYARQKFVNEKTAKDEADDAYREKVAKNAEQAESRTAKKRAKRLKQKAKMKVAKKDNSVKTDEKGGSVESDSDSGDDEDNQNEAICALLGIRDNSKFRREPST